MCDQYLKNDYLIGCDENMVFNKYKFVYEKLLGITGENHIPSQCAHLFMNRAKEIEKKFENNDILLSE